MYYLVKALEDGEPVDLLFHQRRDAKNFIRFVILFINETGHGNGYGSYLLKYPEVAQIDIPLGQGYLDFKRIEYMALEICAARMNERGLSHGGLPYTPLYGIKGGSIVFSFDERHLPPRLVPVAGELARIVEYVLYSGQAGRVAAIVGDKVSLKSVPGGIDREVTVPVANVMKIWDFEKK